MDRFRASRRIPFTILLFALVATACTGMPGGRDPMSPEGQAAWVEGTLEQMPLRDQVASLIVIAVTAGYQHVDDPERIRIEQQVRDLKVGGIAMWSGDPYDEALVIDRLQALAPLPLLVAADNEWGLAMRVGGTSRFPKSMAIGASGDTMLAEEAGRVTGRESRAVGIHMGYGPVADVNNNPLNPIINIRSFGEDPDLVTRMARSWARGAHDAGMLTTAKHFPGHGDVSVDSHLELPTVTGDMDRLESVELAPFRALVASGIDAIMIAHLWVPAFDPDEVVPATLSKHIVGDYLRGELDFQGLIVTDAMRMGAVVGRYGVEEAAVRAIEAGIDLILLPVDAQRSADAIVQAVFDGRIPPERIAASARRLLEAKARLGLHVRRQTALPDMEAVVGDPAVAALSQTIARAAITVVKNEGDLLPLGQGTAPASPDSGVYARGTPPRAVGPFTRRAGSARDSTGPVLFLGLSSDEGSGPVGDAFFAPLRTLYPRAVRVDLYPDIDPRAADAALRGVEGASLVVAAVLSRVRDTKGQATVVPPHATLLRYAAALGVPTVVAAFGPPYFLMQFPGVGAYLAAYDYSDAAQRAAGEMVLGAVGARGALPVSLPGLYPVGWGLIVGPAADPPAMPPPRY